MDEDFARMMMVLVEMKSKDKTNNNEPGALVLQMPKGKGEKKKKKGAETTLFPHELHNLRYHCLLACYAVFSYILHIPEKDRSRRRSRRRWMKKEP